MIHALTFAIYAVTFNGTTVLPHARAAVVDGHVLLPVRALGGALGAEVTYDGRRHTIAIRRGDHQTTIPARGAVRIAGGTAYAPLRAVAGAFGLGVAYDAQARTVALYDGGASAQTAQDAAANGPAPALVAAPTPAPPTYAITESPGDGVQVHEPYPSISARFAGATAIDARSLRVLLDGDDVSGDAAVIGDQVLLTPRRALTPGRHDVRVIARDTRDGTVLDRAWSFVDTFAFTTAPAPTPFPISAIWIDRWIVPGTNAFDVYVEGAPGLTGYVGVDGLGSIFPLRVYTANAYVAHVFAPNGVNQPFARVAARITFPDGQAQTIVLPQTINLTTPPVRTDYPPRPAASPVVRPVPGRRTVVVPDSPAPGATTPPPSQRRRILTASPSPTPAASAAPAPVRTASPLPTRTPSPLPTVRPTPAAAVPSPAATATPAPTPSPAPHRTRKPVIRRPSPSPLPAAPAAPSAAP